jgi:hypothetical protein
MRGANPRRLSCSLTCDCTAGHRRQAIESPSLATSLLPIRKVCRICPKYRTAFYDKPALLFGDKSPGRERRLTTERGDDLSFNDELCRLVFDVERSYPPLVRFIGTGRLVN